MSVVLTNRVLKDLCFIPNSENLKRDPPDGPNFVPGSTTALLISLDLNRGPPLSTIFDLLHSVKVNLSESEL